MTTDPDAPVCVRFVNTVDLRWSTAEEYLRDYGDLLAWAGDERLIDAGRRRSLADLATRDPRAADAAYRTATAFRECLYRVLEASARAATPAADDLAEVNTRLALCKEQVGVDAASGRLVLEVEDVGPPLEVMLGPIARAAAHLLVSASCERLRACPGSPGRACGWLFVDTTRNRNRRYCVGRLCGNRSRVSRHRARREAGSATRGSARGSRSLPAEPWAGFGAPRAE